MSIIGSGNTSASIGQDYMKLLITQLQNQNPLDPMDNNQMASQLTQLAQLEQTEGLNSKFDQILMFTQRTQAASMIGKEVEFIPEGQDTAVKGKVDGVEVVNGNVMLTVGEYVVGVGAVSSIRG